MLWYRYFACSECVQVCPSLAPDMTENKRLYFVCLRHYFLAQEALAWQHQ